MKVSKIIATSLMTLLPILMHGQGNQQIISQLENKYANGGSILVKYNTKYNLYAITKWVERDGEECQLYGICDGRGNEIFSPKYGGLSTPEFGYCIFSKHQDGCKGYVIIDEGRTDESIRFNLYGIIDDQGKMVVPCIYSEIQLIQGTPYAIVEKGGIYYYDDDYNTHAKKFGKWGIINFVDNKEVIKCQFDYIDFEDEEYLDYTYTPFDQMIIDEKVKNMRFRFNIGGKRNDDSKEPTKGKWGYVGLNGKVIIPAQYDNATVFKEGIAQVYKNGEISLIGIDGLPYGINKKAKVDVDIPVTNKRNDNTFAFIIANENYNALKGADYSINDGKIFAEYCKKTLGIPDKNIKYYEDASYGTMQSAIKRMYDIADAYDGEASVIFYFSGLGATSTKDGKSYFLPSDVSIGNLNVTGFGVQQLSDNLNQMNIQNALVIIDAPFSNTDKFGNSLLNSRGIAIKSKPLTPTDKVTFFISSEDGKKTYSNKEYSHSLFTYALLEKIKECKGNCSYDELFEYVKTYVKKESLNLFNELQSPVIIATDETNLKTKKL